MTSASTASLHELMLNAIIKQMPTPTILKFTNRFATARSVSDFLKIITKWHLKYPVPAQGYYGGVWFRGHSERSWGLDPCVYRENFTAKAKSFRGADLDEARLNLERLMLAEFRTAGSSYFGGSSIEFQYFLAQHYGMPTRLLDWTTNPLAALFFAISEKESADGEVFLMDPTKLTPRCDSASVLSVHDEYARQAIGMSLGNLDPINFEPRILPIRPDGFSGRIRQP